MHDMYIYIYVYKYSCTGICTHAYLCTCIEIYICVCILHIRVRTDLHIHVRKDVHIHGHIRIYKWYTWKAHYDSLIEWTSRLTTMANM